MSKANVVIRRTIDDLVEIGAPSVHPRYRVAVGNDDRNCCGPDRLTERTPDFGPICSEQFERLGIVPVLQREADGIGMMQQIGSCRMASRPSRSVRFRGISVCHRSSRFHWSTPSIERRSMNPATLTLLPVVARDRTRRGKNRFFGTNSYEKCFFTNGCSGDYDDRSKYAPVWRRT